MGLPKFRVQIAGANSFVSAPFLEVFCPDAELGKIRRCLLRTENEQRFSPYVPHITVGLYRQPSYTVDVADSLSPYRDLERLNHIVQSIDLVSLDGRNPVGELRVEDRVNLGF